MHWGQKCHLLPVAYSSSHLVPAGPLSFDLAHSVYISLPSQTAEPGCEETRLFFGNEKLNIEQTCSCLLTPCLTFTSKGGEEESLVSGPPNYSHDHVFGVLLPACVFSAAFLCGKVGKGPENVTTPGSGTTCSLIFFLCKIVINNRHYFYVLWLSEIKWENLSCNKNINVYFFDVIFSAMCYALMSTYFYICLLWSNSLIGRQETLNDLERSLLKTNLRGLER